MNPFDNTFTIFFREMLTAKIKGQFEWRDFIAQNNNELLAKLGNFVNRIVKLINSKIYNSVIPDYTVMHSDPVFTKTKEEINNLLSRYLKELEAVDLKDGLQTAMDIAQVCTKHNFVLGLRTKALFYPPVLF